MPEEPSSFLIEHSSLQARALDRLRDEIVSGVWKPGERLQERTLCQRFGISRSPLREAYRVLAAEGLLELARNRGAIVAAPSPEDVLQHHVLLEALETLAIELACDQATDAEIAAIVAKHEEEHGVAGAEAYRLNNELHRMIVMASHNRPVQDAHLVAQRRLIQVQNVNGFQGEPVPPLAEHERFVRALVKRSRAEAARALRAHLANVKIHLKTRLETIGHARRA
ncbi:MAG: GntR family transcriptional regulator, partial [Candidatus Binatia bacterium]